MVGLLDASEDRVHARFIAMVESVRVGTVIAHDRRALDNWHRTALTRPGREPGMVGQDLEQAVGRIANLFPNNVERGLIGAT